MTPVSPLDAEKIVEEVSLYVFRIAFTASLLVAKLREHLFWTSWLESPWGYLLSVPAVQVGLEFSSSLEVVTVILYKCRLLKEDDCNFDNVYLKTVYR